MFTPGRWLLRPLLPLALVLGNCGVHSQDGATPPRAVLWAWERHEDLSFLQPGDAVVAPVVATVRLEGPRAALIWRPQQLHIPPGIELWPVVHVDAVAPRDPPQLLRRQGATIVYAILRAAALFPGRQVQLDFEARVSQRAFFADIVREVKQRAPDLRLSVTALASWCAGDRWLAGLPVDEVVPMLFRMGRDGAQIRDRVRANGRLPAPECARALGVSLDAWRPPSASVPTVYVFSPKPWTRQRFNTYRNPP